MSDVSDVFDGVQKVFSFVAGNASSAVLSSVGVILLVVAIIVGARSMTLRPEQIQPWLRSAFFMSLVGGMIFSAAGPGVALLTNVKPGAPTDWQTDPMPRDIAFDDVGSNTRVRWLIRLIAFDPSDHPELGTSTLTKLGPDSQQYTFVADYDELKRLNVLTAIERVGGTYRNGMHVLAVMFPVPNGIVLYPANARGVLQVIKAVQEDTRNAIARPFPLNRLDEPDLDDLGKLQIWTWTFDNYKERYPRYCNLVQDFRCANPAYSAANYIGGLQEDWHPLGFSRTTHTNPCTSAARQACQITDWSALKASLLTEFGSRVFLMKNLQISSLRDRITIEFNNPSDRAIPDIGSTVISVAGR